MTVRKEERCIEKSRLWVRTAGLCTELQNPTSVLTGSDLQKLLRSVGLGSQQLTDRYKGCTIYRQNGTAQPKFLIFVTNYKLRAARPKT